MQMHGISSASVPNVSSQKRTVLSAAGAPMCVPVVFIYAKEC